MKFTFDGMTPEVPKIEEEQVVETTETNNQQDQSNTKDKLFFVNMRFVFCRTRECRIG